MPTPNDSLVHTANHVALAAVLLLAACGRSEIPQQPPLGPVAQRAVAERIARGFAEVCLTTTDALSATRTLQSQGWPAFGVVWNHPGSVSYAATPSPALPAGLSVMGDRRQSDVGAPVNLQLTCVGHYQADGAAPMVQAIERRWGASHDGPPSLAGSRAWTFRMENGAFTTVSTSGATDGPVQAAMLTALRPGEALVYLQVFYSPMMHDVASVISVWRPAP
ncbi:MAG TPA: hypothetical protein VN814_24275 [Caulobacteraceae bacterium]|nr:hypothetical protein [Caulobacteraceae bacterium]